MWEEEKWTGKREGRREKGEGRTDVRGGGMKEEEQGELMNWYWWTDIGELMIKIGARTFI